MGLLDRTIPTTGGNAPSFQPSGASSSFFRELSSATKQISNDMKAKSDTLYINHFMTDARKAAREIYEKNKSDPEQLEIEARNYQDGLLSNMPAELRPALQSEYGSLIEERYNVARSNQIKIRNHEIEESILSREDELIQGLQFSARQLFSSNEGLTPEEVIIKNGDAVSRMAIDMDALERNLSQIGADGEPLRTPEQINRSIVKAKEFLFTETASTWLDSQPNKLTAYNQWLNNEVKIETPDGVINIRDAMTPEVRQKTDKQLIQNIKNDIFIEKQQVERVEKAQDEFRDETKKILFDRTRTGELDLRTVEASRNILDFQDYRDFSKLAREANPITNGDIYGRLLNKISNGEDVSQQIRIERFTNKTLSNEDFESLLEKNEKKDIFPDPEKGARDTLRGLLGGESELLDVAGSATIASAELELKNRFRSFTETQGRRPTEDEAQEIMFKVSDRYSLIDLDSYAATIPKPSQMPREMKAKSSQLTEEGLKEVRQKTVDFYMNKYNGDKERMKQDPEFARDVEGLQKFDRILLLKKERQERTK